MNIETIYTQLEELVRLLIDHTALPEQEILLVAACALAGLTLTLVASRIHISFSRAPSRALADYVAYANDAPESRSGEHLVDKDAVILLSLGLPVQENLLTTIRLGAGGIPVLLLMLFGFPLVPALGGGALIYILTDAYLNSQWRKMRVRIEGELPTFVSRLAGTLLVTGSPIKAISEVADTLNDDSQLNAWIQRMLSGTRMEGRQFFDQARAEAAIISPSLALVVFQMGRFFETGGAGFTKAFATTAEELSAILEARAIAGSKAESARQAVLMMLGIMGLIMLMMFSSPNIRQGFENVTVQVVTAAAMAAMAFGYSFLNSMIDEALEG